MKSWRMIAMVMAMTGCAAIKGMPAQDTEMTAGHWNGLVDRDGWQRHLYLDIEGEGSAWRGGWRSLPEGSDLMLKDLEVHGSEVRFDTDKLRFIGHLEGNRISGTVVELPAGTSAGEFSLAREEPEIMISG